MKNLRISKANKRKSEPVVNLLALLDTKLLSQITLVVL